MSSLTIITMQVKNNQTNAILQYFYPQLINDVKNCWINVIREVIEFSRS